MVALTTILLAISATAATPIQPATSPAQSSRSAAGNSFNPIFSADGRHLVFVSQANNLVTNDDLALNQDVFVRDLTNQITTLVSVNTNDVGGGNFDANFPSISSNGQWIAFASTASNLSPKDSNELSDVFVRDLANGITRLVSMNISATSSANGKSSAPLISADGRWVIFESTATNLVAGQFTTNLLQIYACDLQSNLTCLVSVNESGTGPGNGTAESPAISADGQRIAFVGTATNIVSGMTNQQGEIFVRNLQTGDTTWASSNLAGYFAGSTNGYRCFNPVLSRDGARLAFKASGSGPNQLLVFWVDLNAGNTICVASNSLDASWPELSADGRWLAFEDGTNVFVWDSQQQTNLLVNVSYDGANPANGPAKTPVLSADGRTVLFLASATDMMVSNAPAPSSNQVFQLYARSLESNVTWLVSANQAGGASSASLEFAMPVVSSDGGSVAFESADDDLVSGDQNRAADIFLRRPATSELELISVRHDSRPARTGTGHCIGTPLSLSADGRFAVIRSADSTVNLADTNQTSDIYFVDLVAGTNLHLPTPPLNSTSVLHSAALPAISSDTSQAVFVRGPDEGYVFNRNTSALNLFNLNNAGEMVAGAFSNSPAVAQWSACLSPDGRWLAFSAYGAFLSGMSNSTYLNIYLRDLAAGTNLLVSYLEGNPLSGDAVNSFQPMFSPDGRWLFYTSLSGKYSLWIYDTYTATRKLISSNSPFTFTYSVTTQYVFLSSGGGIGRYDLLATNSSISSVVNVGICWHPSASTNGKAIAYYIFNTSGGNSSGGNIRFRDLEQPKSELISVSTNGIDGANLYPYRPTPPQITPDGRFVLFASIASNLVPNDTNGCSDIFLRDRLLGLTYLLSANPITGCSGNRASISPLMSSDGSTIIFASMASDLVQGDYNDRQDIFVVKLARGDSDGDGLDDAWEMAYFGNLAQDGSGDADGDGLKDREEFRAGTDPTNQGSVLRALAVAPVGGQSTTLIWPAATGRQYQIQFKRSVTDTNWTVLPATVTVTGNTASAVDTQAGLDAARFYRILILP